MKTTTKHDLQIAKMTSSFILTHLILAIPFSIFGHGER
jgi:hypothetical protein